MLVVLIMKRLWGQVFYCRQSSDVGALHSPPIRATMIVHIKSSLVWEVFQVDDIKIWWRYSFNVGVIVGMRSWKWGWLDKNLLSYFLDPSSFCSLKSLIDMYFSSCLLCLAMDPSSSQGRHHVKTPRVYSCRSSARAKVERKIKICLDLLHILDGVLHEFILMVCVKL